MMVKALVLVFFLALAHAFPNNAHLRRPPSERIVGGELVTIESRPFQVSLQAFGIHNCGGSIISPDTILTAAHCIDGILSLFYKVVAGTADLTKGGVVIDVKSTLVHEEFNGIDHDVAIIKLREPLVFSDKIQAVKLADTDPKDGAEVTVSGWGTLHYADLFTPKDLSAVNVSIVNREVCKQDYQNLEDSFHVTPRMICAGSDEGGKDSCSGDSGGPITVDGVQFGIVSWGQQCGLKGYPGVYSDIPSLREWIRKHAGV